jgi:lipopolysaccharide/colanic/teichoic acid biosynthesis glycosyltransferase
MTAFPQGVPVTKRILDILVSLFLLVLLSPFLLILSLLVLVNQGLPIFFSQERPGLNGKIFRMWKFRTMSDRRDEQGGLLPDADRLTSVGRFLRRYSLDELPELVNVLKGEMSLVGPRPLLIAYLERYSPEQARRHLVLPGMTGWAQVNGRNAISWQKKFELDVWYVDHWSFGLDLKILWMTIGKVFHGADIAQPGRATMDEFMGNDAEK